MSESSGTIARTSTFRADTSVTNKFGIADRRISFLDLVEFALPGDKPEVALAVLTRRHVRTCRRWLKQDNHAPAIALAAVLGEIIRRLE